MSTMEHMSPVSEHSDEVSSLPNKDELDPCASDLDGEAMITRHEDASFHIVSDDSTLVCSPPPRLAERFYRNAEHRRKSSAASSRRNSLSSSHSHGSSRSLRRASSCQSNYIAQHLRRASIIESRKARLADRAAHAEQVRLRAALAKAAPRGNVSSSEERALAAQIAREKYLAKVTAACAGEVQKAKQKAQEMKVRKMEEERRVRQDMEDRLAEAEKRRSEYQRNIHARRLRRASSQEKKLAVVVEDIDTDAEADKLALPSLDDETAARRIQRAWTTRKRRAIAQAYIDLDLTIDSIRDRSFEDVGELVLQPRVTAATSNLLRLFALQEGDCVQSAASTRTFLSAYLIVTHPESVLSKNGAQEQDMIVKSTELLDLFEAAVLRLASWNRFYPSPTQLEELAQMYATYAAAFDAWRAQDSSALVETMVASFVELDAIWQTVKDDTQGGAANEYREGIRDNQVILLSKIRKLAGADRADFLIKKSIRESRRRRGKRRTAAETRPRIAEAATIEEVAHGPVGSLDASNSTVDASATTQETGSDTHSFASLFSPIPNNRILTHELAINKDFRIPASAHSDVRDVVNRKLCDSMREGVDQGEGAAWTTAMAECIRGKLLGILKPGNSMHTVIAEALDSDHIFRQCNQGVFSYERFFDFMASIMPKLCAPFRDDQVKILANDLNTSENGTASMIEKLFRLLHFIDLLSLDYSNFLLMNAAPVLIRESAGYEQRMFAHDLESGAVTLQKTIRWWRNASVNLLTEADRRDPEQIRLPANRPTAQKIYTRALVDLAISQDQTLEGWPESLQLDCDRIAEIRRSAIFITCIGATLLTAKNLLKRDVRSPWKSEASRLWEILSKEDLTAEESAQKMFGILDSAHNLPPTTKSALQGACVRFTAQAMAGRLSDPVLKVLFQRLKGHVFARVSASSSRDRVRAASTAIEGLASAGLPEFTTQIGEMVDLLGRVAEVDWKSHAMWYEQMAHDVQSAGEA